MNTSMRKRGEKSWRLTIDLGKDAGNNWVPDKAQEAQQ